FELTTTDGVNTGLTAIATVPASGHISKFVTELFPTLTLPFTGVLRTTSFSSITVVSLQSAYNERADFLMTTTPVSNEASPSSNSTLVFPQIVDGGGWTTQFILFSGIAGQIATGTIQFFGQNGQALNLTVR